MLIPHKRQQVTTPPPPPAHTQQPPDIRLLFNTQGPGCTGKHHPRQRCPATGGAVRLKQDRLTQQLEAEAAARAAAASVASGAAPMAGDDALPAAASVGGGVAVVAMGGGNGGVALARVDEFMDDDGAN